MIKDATSASFQIQPIKPDTQRDNFVMKVQSMYRLVYFKKEINHDNRIQA